MAKEKEILRLRSLGMSQKAIMSVVHCASRKIKSTYEKADELSITYELIKDKTDDEIEEIFGNKKEVIISGSSTTQFTTSAPVVDNRSTISANK